MPEGIPVLTSPHNDNHAHLCGERGLPSAGGQGGPKPERRRTRAKAANAPEPPREAFGQPQFLLDAIPGLVAMVTGPDHVIDYANDAWKNLVNPDVVDRKLKDVLCEGATGGMLELLDQMRSGEVDSGEVRTRFANPTESDPVQGVNIEFQCRRVWGADGAFIGVALQGSDVTKRLQAEEWQQLLMRELAHRVKNFSGTVLGLARLARGSATDLDSFLDSLTDRLVAISRTQNLLDLVPSHSVNVKEILDLELGPYAEEHGRGRVSVNCQDLALQGSSAAGFSMIVHELLTNALKYGALSARGGTLQVTCEAAGADALMTWCETTDEAVGVIGKTGFGGRLMERLTHRIGGKLNVTSRQDGVDVSVAFRVEEERQPL